MPQPYYFGQEARYEGSGGAAGDKDGETGGFGGGIVWITSRIMIASVNSSFYA